jgi:hypothetical protein
MSARIGWQTLMARIVALMESMWGWGGYNTPGEEAPRFFSINPDNHSGKRLYRLCGDHTLLVTNCCPTVQASANDHGVPDLQWVRDNLAMAGEFELLLVCGKIAQATYAKIKEPNPRFQVMLIDHPAARRWTKASLIKVAEEIAQKCPA